MNSSAQSADSLAGVKGKFPAEEVSQEEPVDSWEDIADSAESSSVGGADSQVVVDKPVHHTNKLVIQNDSHLSKSSPSLTESEKESGNQGLSTTGTSSVSNGNSRKNPSPNLSEKKPGRSESSKQSAAAAALLLPPPKTEDDKENLNIVFIGHVGEDDAWMYM